MSIRGQISTSPIIWLYVVIIGSGPRSSCILTIDPIGSSIQSWNWSSIGGPAGVSLSIRGSPSQQLMERGRASPARMRFVSAPRFSWSHSFLVFELHDYEGRVHEASSGRSNG